MKKALALVLAFLMCLSIVVVWAEKSQATEEPSKTTETNRGMTIGAGRLHTVAHLADGTVVIAGDKEDGQGDGVEDWKDIIAVSYERRVRLDRYRSHLGRLYWSGRSQGGRHLDDYRPYNAPPRCCGYLDQLRYRGHRARRIYHGGPQGGRHRGGCGR